MTSVRVNLVTAWLTSGRLSTRLCRGVVRGVQQQYRAGPVGLEEESVDHAPSLL